MARPVMRIPPETDLSPFDDVEDATSVTLTKAPRRVSDLAIETVARGFFREADRYGFSQADFLRFINSVLGLSMAATEARVKAGEPAPAAPVESFISDDRVAIRPFNAAEHAAILLEWLQDDAGAQFLRAGTNMHPITPDQVLADPTNVLGMIVLPDGRPIGATAFLHIDREHRKAEMRKLIGEPALRGQGFGKAATRIWIQFGFRTLGLHKIYINTLNTNLRNVRLNEALGFRLEGILHDEVFLDGQYHDVLRMAIWDQ
jgi:RimJ/RimL family protein N-acetyltransferase